MDKKPHHQLKQIESLFTNASSLTSATSSSSTNNINSSSIINTSITSSGSGGGGGSPHYHHSPRSSKSPEVTIIESVRDFKCDVHGGRRGSSGSVSANANSVNNNNGVSAASPSTSSSSPTVAPKRDSVVSINGVSKTSTLINKRNSIGSNATNTNGKSATINVVPTKTIITNGPSAGTLPRKSSTTSGIISTPYGPVQMRKKRESIDREMIPLSNRENSSTSTPTSSAGVGVQRRQSFTGNRKLSGDVARKRNTWNPTMFNNTARIEHPSAFPSMLRAGSVGPTSTSQSQLDIRNSGSNGGTIGTPLSQQLNNKKRDLYGGSVATISTSHTSNGILPSAPSRSTSTSNLLRRRESFGSNTLNRRDSFGGSNIINRRPMLNSSQSTLKRRDSFGSNSILGSTQHLLLNNNNSNGNRRDSFGSTLSRGDSLDLKLTKRDSFNGGQDLRRQSFGSSIYLRPDSSGHTNLIRRDSFGSQKNLRKESIINNSLNNSGGGGSRSSVPRDYVSKSAAISEHHHHDHNNSSKCNIKSHNLINEIFTTNSTVPKKETNSILRKDSWKNSNTKHVSYENMNGGSHNNNNNDHNDHQKNGIDTVDSPHKLTTANLTKHVTILEENFKKQNLGKKLSFDEDNLSTYSRDRRNSNGSAIGNYLASSRRISIDSLETRRNSWDRRSALGGDGGRRGSHSSSIDIDVIKLQQQLDEQELNAQNDPNRPRFVAVTALEDVQAVRCAEFHPNGKVYSVGSNSKTFRICEYPSLSEIREEHTTYQPTVLFKRTKHHKGSIYCMAWSPQGDLVATGSNDKTVKLMRYDEIQQQLEGKEIELTMHDGTVRDLCFLEDSTNKTSLLISGGAGDCKVYVTDCATSTPFQALSGHGGHILSLYNWGGAMFVSGSQDKTVRFWDLRTRGCVNTVTPATVPGSRQGSPVAAVCVDPSGRLLVSGHEDSSCVLYDIRGNRPIQCFKPHATDIRSIRFSPSAYYLLTGGYDNKLVLTDLQGDLTMPLPSVVVAQHSDKVISGRWHPTDFSFLSTSADKTATLWALPPI